MIITTTTFLSKLNVNCVQQTSSLSLFNKPIHAPPVLIYTVLETLILTEMPYMISNAIGIHHPFRTMELTIMAHYQQTTLIIQLKKYLREAMGGKLQLEFLFPLWWSL